MKRVVYFKTDFGNWGYRITEGRTIREAFGFKTKRQAMRDYKRNGAA
jgi:hypothetical protein